MNYRQLGASGLRVSEISLGSWLTYGEGGYVDSARAHETIDKAYELGINFFDTANIYMRGEAEKVVGQALGKYARESYVIATKVWGRMGEGPNDRGLSRKHIMEQCEASLKRLNLDYIDLYYCHHFDPDTPMEETLRAMDDLVTQGKVFYIGVSNWTAAQIAEAVHLADRKLLNRIVASQPVYNMFNRAIEQELIPACTRFGIGQVVYSPLAQGVLAGKYKNATDVPPDSRATHSSGKQTIQRYLHDDNLLKVARIREIADELGLTLSQLAIAWILRQSNVSSALIGASRVQQVEENAVASGVSLPNDALEQIESILNN
ncbi:aldo/keto reductase family protein [Paenibacillus sp. SAFN-117]|uniref:aldo/keto reductase family protein n=1 Tax=Paenibacillus sp. SAFN-117 TaxID=3436860 RepID=UPI003F80F24B